MGYRFIIFFSKNGPEVQATLTNETILVSKMSITVLLYSRAMKTQHPNIHQYLNVILKILSQRISGDFMSTKDGHHIDFISFNMKWPNVNTRAHIPTVVKSALSE